MQCDWTNKLVRPLSTIGLWGHGRLEDATRIDVGRLRRSNWRLSQLASRGHNSLLHPDLLRGRHHRTAGTVLRARHADQPDLGGQHQLTPRAERSVREPAAQRAACDHPQRSLVRTARPATVGQRSGNTTGVLPRRWTSGLVTVSGQPPGVHLPHRHDLREIPAMHGHERLRPAYCRC